MPCLSSRSSGQAGVVVCNYDAERSIAVQIKMDESLGAGNPKQYRTVDDPTWRNVEDGITISPRSAVIAI